MDFNLIVLHRFIALIDYTTMKKAVSASIYYSMSSSRYSKCQEEWIQGPGSTPLAEYIAALYTDMTLYCAHLVWCRRVACDPDSVHNVCPSLCPFITLSLRHFVSASFSVSYIPYTVAYTFCLYRTPHRHSNPHPLSLSFFNLFTKV